MPALSTLDKPYEQLPYFWYNAGGVLMNAADGNPCTCSLGCLSRDTATFTFIPSILLYLRLLPGTDERYSIEDVGHHE